MILSKDPHAINLKIKENTGFTPAFLLEKKLRSSRLETMRILNRLSADSASLKEFQAGDWKMSVSGSVGMSRIK